jgi:hypothetical protein
MAGPLRSTDIAPLRCYYGPSRHPLAFGRFPGLAGYTAYLAPPISRRDEEGFSSCSACPRHRAVAFTPPRCPAVSVSVRLFILLSPSSCGLSPWDTLSRPQCVHCCYGPVTRNLPWGGLVDRLRRFCFHFLRYPNYGALTFTPAGLSPAEHASLIWTYNWSRYCLRKVAIVTAIGVGGRGGAQGTNGMKPLPDSHRRHRFPTEVIGHAICVRRQLIWMSAV